MTDTSVLIIDLWLAKWRLLACNANELCRLAPVSLSWGDWMRQLRPSDLPDLESVMLLAAADKKHWCKSSRAQQIVLLTTQPSPPWAAMTDSLQLGQRNIRFEGGFLHTGQNLLQALACCVVSKAQSKSTHCGFCDSVKQSVPPLNTILLLAYRDRINASLSFNTQLRVRKTAV